MEPQHPILGYVCISAQTLAWTVKALTRERRDFDNEESYLYDCKCVRINPIVCY